MGACRRLAHLFLFVLVAFSLEWPKTEAVTGGGGLNVANLITAWGDAYRFAQDDVQVTYQVSSAYRAALAYLKGQSIDFPVSEAAQDVEKLASYNGTQFPLVASGLAIIYNLPDATHDLILNRTVLASIWIGNITTWDDPSIRELNPDMSDLELPHVNITLPFDSFGALDLTAVLMGMLSKVSEDFKTAYHNASLTLYENMAKRAKAIPFSTSDARLFYVQDTPYTMSYSSLQQALDMSFQQAKLYNKAGSLVHLSLDSVKSAMDDLSNSTTYLAVSLSDNPGVDSWPLAYFEFLTLAYNSTGVVDCGDVQDMLAFLAWAQFNDKASEVAQLNGYVPLTNHFRKRVFDSLYNITCQGKRAFNTAVLIGSGGQSSTFPKWASAYESSTFLLKYFETTDDQALEDSLQLNIDFGATSSYRLASTERTNGIDTPGDDLTDSDLEALPVVAYAIVPAYHVSELSGQNETLVFDLQIIADILSGRVTKWNDAAMIALNPDLEDLLPDAFITVVVTTDSALENLLLTTVLNQSTVNWEVRYPVVDTPHALDLAPSYVTSGAVGNSHSFTVWNYKELHVQRTLSIGRMVNSANNIVTANQDSVVASLDYMSMAIDARVELRSPGVVLARQAGSWPVVAVSNFLIHVDDAVDCNKAQALAEWLYWSQTSTAASDIAARTGVVVAAKSSLLNKKMLTFVSNIQCDGEYVSSIHGCVWEGTLCANEGRCIEGECKCNSSRAGKYCQDVSTTSDALIIGLTVGLVLPAIVCCVLIFLGLALAFALYVRSNRRHRDEWEIDMDELEFGEQLGAGGNGEVFKGMWKGTDVAIKMMTAEQVTREMERNFKEEVRVMTALRHPNVVLFMAACTKPPKMCIVMEYMALGSLFDFLHNELVPAVPFALVLKIAYQAAKGMHFLHSSGIVHRDLKSLNLLLDNKWNIKVSDFGLTKFNEELKHTNKGDNIQGSVHWTAPEILNEWAELDYILSDVYSFGIILWELITRQQPYNGMSPAAIAVSVIRDNLRPELPDATDQDEASAEYRELITNCWHRDATVRPTFLEVMTRLSTMSGESAFTSSKSSSSSKLSSAQMSNGSWNSAPHFSNSIHTSQSSSNSSSGGGKHAAAAGGGIPPPDGEVTILFSDITRAASLWEFNAAAMKEATLLHNQLLRSLLKEHKGYEVVFIRDKNSGEGSFCMAFQRTADALEWCMAVHQELLNVEWPEGLLDHPGAAEEWGDIDDRVIFRGLRVRMGIHVGRPRMLRDAMSRRVEYIGPVVNAAARITSVANGGQIMLSQAAYEMIKDTDLAKEKNRFSCLGRFEMPDSVDSHGAKVWEMRSRGLEGRYFNNGMARKHADVDDSADSQGNSSRNEDAGEVESLDNVGEGMTFKEDNFLTSANLCRWVIDFKDLQLGKQVGMGSYGVVFKGLWKGVDVAVKKFVKQKLDERRMLEFRAEMAFLAELHHPNIVLFIGACVKRPNLCIVTEFVKQGSLNELLLDSSVRLPWNQRMRMLRSAALGVNYLHSLSPCIIHRDLKPSNLLVDENWNVKVADFGFARIKEENATMTRCGTPSWTAPEIIRGEKYSEKADVYSFGMTMWQMATRKQPFAGRNFMGVSLDVLEGKRPPLPADCPPIFAKTVTKCWHAKPDKRPSMEDVIVVLNQLTGDHSLDVGDSTSSIAV